MRAALMPSAGRIVQTGTDTRREAPWRYFDGLSPPNQRIPFIPHTVPAREDQDTHDRCAGSEPPPPQGVRTYILQMEPNDD